MKLEVVISGGVLVAGVLIGLALLVYAASNDAGGPSDATSESAGESLAAQFE